MQWLQAASKLRSRRYTCTGCGSQDRPSSQWPCEGSSSMQGPQGVF